VVLGSRPKQRPSLLGLSARSALTRDARAGCALRARGQCPLPVCPSPASWQAQPGRAQCRGVSRHSPGRVRGPVWAKNRSGRALTCVSFPPSQRRAPFRGIHKGGGAHVVLESRPKQRPSLLGLSARSALTRDTRARCASRARGQRPLPVCPSPASFVRRFVRAECSGVLRHSPGRASGACLDKKQVGAGCDMRVFSTQPKAGPLPGVP
ncbi:hypothetical protein C814_03308, partial [Anaerotruncus sp. G3(2012)]